MAIKKQQVADNGILSQGASTFSNTVSIAGTTTANGVAANTVAVTNGVTANTVTSNTVATVATTSNTYSGNSITIASGAAVANSIGVFTSTVNAISVIATTANTALLNVSGVANVATANVQGNLTVGGNTAITGNVIVSGTLTVQGGVTTVNSTQVNIADNVITLNSDYTTAIAPTENAGIEVKRGNASDVGIRWNETSDYWELSDAAGTYSRIRTGATTVALGSETTGNYVASASGSGNGLTVSGTGAGAVVTIAITAANTSTVGTVQLIDSVASSNVTTAATPNSVKTAYDAAISANTLAAGKVASVSGTGGRISSSGGATPTIDLVTTGVSAGTYTKLTVDVYGRATANGTITTDDVPEGSNLYHTTARVRGAITNGTGISYDAPSGTITNSDKGSDQLFFKSIADSVGTVVFAATTNQDTIRFGGGTGITATLNASTKTVSFDSTGVTSFNTRSGAVTLQLSDVTGVTGTLVNSFNTRTGAVTLTSGDVTTALGDTPASSSSGVTSFNTRTGSVTLSSGDVTGALGYTPATTTQAANASYLSAGTVANARISGAYTNITGVGTLTSLAVNGTTDVNLLTTDAGSASAPSHSFNTDLDTGMFRVSTNTLGWAAAGVQRMSLSTSTLAVNGAITATSTITASSDARLKKDVTEISPWEGIRAVRALQPVKFTRIADESKSSGYIAQDVQEIMPEQVIEDDNGYLAIDLVGASPYHTAAIKFLCDEIEALKTRVNFLEYA
jgi:hypothetical protein